MSNPLSNMADAVNRIVTPHLKAISDINNRKYDRNLERQKLEEDVIESSTRLGLQREMYESEIQSSETRANAYADSVRSKAEVDRRDSEVEALESGSKALNERLGQLQEARAIAALSGDDTAHIDAQLEATRTQLEGIRKRQIETIAPLPPAQITPPVQRPQLQVPQRAFQQTGFEDIQGQTFYGPAPEQFQQPSTNFYQDQPVAVPTPVGPLLNAGPITNGRTTTFGGRTDAFEAGYGYKNWQGVELNPDDPYTSVSYDELKAMGVPFDGGTPKLGGNTKDFLENNYVRRVQKPDGSYIDIPVRDAGPRLGMGAVDYSRGAIQALGRDQVHDESDRLVGVTDDSPIPSQLIYIGGEQLEPGEEKGLPTQKSGGIELPAAGQVIENSLFPASPEEREMPVAQPILVEDELPEEVPADFFADEPLIINDGPGQPTSLIINDNPEPVAPQATPEPPQEPKQTVTREAIDEVLLQAGEIEDEDRRKDFLSRVSSIVRQKNPSIYDEDFASYARGTILAGGSPTDFRASLPDHMKQMIGDDRAMQIYHREAAVEMKNKETEQLNKKLLDLADQIGTIDLKIAEEEGKPDQTKVNTSVVGILKSQREALMGRQQALQQKLYPPTDPIEPPAEEPAQQDPAVDISKAYASPSATFSGPPSSIRDAIAQKFNISPAYLGDFDVSEERPGLIQGFVEGVGLSPSFNEEANTVVRGFIESERSKFNQSPQKSALFEAAKTHISENLDSVLSFAASSGFKLPLTGKGGKETYLDFAAELGLVSTMDADGLSNSEDRKRELLAILQEKPDYMVALARASMVPEMATKARQAIIEYRNKKSQLKKNTSETLLRAGLPEDL